MVGLYKMSILLARFLSPQQLTNCPHQTGPKTSLCVRAPPTVGSASPGLVVLDAIRKQAEQVMGSKPVSSILLWSPHQLLLPGSALEFLP